MGRVRLERRRPRRLGLHPGGGHFLLITQAAGAEMAAAMRILGQQALPDGEVDDAARRLALPAAADPPLTRQAARSLRTTTGPPVLPWPAALEFERAAQMWSMRRRAGARRALS